MNGTVMADKPTWCSFDSAEALAQQLASDVAARLNTAILDRGGASLVVSGGATPYPFFTALRAIDVPWHQVWVTLTDERCVPITHEGSNEKMLRERLLDPSSAFLSLAPKTGESQAQAIDRLEPLMQAYMPFDVVVLGMGIDSHVASLFPGNPVFSSVSQPTLIAVEQAPKAPPSRISMTPDTLLNTTQLIIHITGEGKRGMLETALASGDSVRYPIAAFLHQQQTPVTIYWSAE